MKPVRRATAGLKELYPFFRVEWYTSPRTGRRGNRYVMELPSERGSYIALYRTLIDSGYWGALHGTPSAWSLYPVLRHFAKAPTPTDFDCEGDREAYLLEYASRSYDVIQLDRRKLCRVAGISRNSFAPALAALIEIGLVSPHPAAGLWRVLIQPP